MKKTIKYMLSVICEHLIFAIVSLTIITITGGLFKNNLWIASVITGIIYLTSIYSTGWRNSGKDMRSAKARYARGETDAIDFRPYDGFLHALALLLISAIVFLCMIFSDSKTPFMIYRIYNFSFIFIFEKLKKSHMFEILVVFLPYLSYSIGYIAGKNGKTLVVHHIDKLVYKPKKK